MRGSSHSLKLLLLRTKQGSIRIKPVPARMELVRARIQLSSQRMRGVELQAAGS